MPDPNSDPARGGHSTAKRSLPSWMSAVENRNTSQKRQKDTDEILPSNRKKETSISHDATQNNFSKLLEGVHFALSGFVNPERGALRAQAMEMGAEYQPDWSSDCTLLICAFPGTPKFKQVETANGTIVSKEWIFECYKCKKLVDIEGYLMHVGKPWRRFGERNQSNKVQGSGEETTTKIGKRSSAMIGSASSEGKLSSSSKNNLLPSKIKEWAADDLRKTMSWLESQDEKPAVNEIRGVAAEGIITCLQDAINSLKQNKNIKTATEQWMFVPRIVTYLEELEGGNRHGLLPKEELYEAADSCKKIYASEFKKLISSPKNEIFKNKGVKFENFKNEGNEERSAEPVDEGFDSDRTVEMTEEEIDFTCKQLGYEF